MSLGVFFDYDIRNILLSLYQSLYQSGVDGDYRRGYEAALISAALAFGIDLKAMPEMQAAQLAIPKQFREGR